jgi:hypothetical protein
MEASAGEPRKRWPVATALCLLVAGPFVAAGMLWITILLVKDEAKEVALPALITVGLLAVVTSWVALSAASRNLKDDSLPSRLADGSALAPIAGDTPQRGLTLTQGIVLLLTLVVLTAVPAGVVVGTVTLLKERDTFLPEIALPVIVLVGVIGLLAVLATLVAVYRRFDLVDEHQPLGMPEGSIQAVIALSLILIFAIIGVYLHGRAGTHDERLVTGLTQEKLDALPVNTIEEINTRDDGRFDVRVALPQSEQQNDISTQLLTTISTLVVAVAGFYFGSKSVKEATAAATQGRRRREDEGQDDGDGEPESGAPGGNVDEATAYGEESGITGLGSHDIEADLTGEEIADLSEEEAELADEGIKDSEEAAGGDVIEQPPTSEETDRGTERPEGDRG